MLELTAKHSEAFVCLNEVKANLRVIDSAEDLLLQRLTDTACLYVQEQAGKQLNADTYKLTISAFRDPLFLPLRPVSSISQVQYFDSSNVSQITADYRFINSEDKPYLLPLENQSWPDTYSRYDAVSVTFVTGYPSTIIFPENLKQAAIMLASHWYEHRTPAGLKMEGIPHGVDSLINLSKAGWYV